MLSLRASSQAPWILCARETMNSFYYLMNGNQDSSQCTRVDSMQTVKYKGFLKIYFFKVLVP